MRDTSKYPGVVFLAAVRTPFGTFGGKLKGFSPIDLAVHASKSALDRAGVDPIAVDQTIFGNVLYTTSDSIYFARHQGVEVGHSTGQGTTHGGCALGRTHRLLRRPRDG